MLFLMSGLICVGKLEVCVAKKTQPVRSCCSFYTSIKVLLCVLQYYYALNIDTNRYICITGILLYSRIWEGCKVAREKAVEIFTKTQLNRLHQEGHFLREQTSQFNPIFFGRNQTLSTGGSGIIKE